MAGVAQFVFSGKALMVCFALWPGASSPAVGVLYLLALFVVFLVPFDRRLLDRYAQYAGAKSAEASLKGALPPGKPAEDNGVHETAMPGGPYTRRLCKMLALEVIVLRDASSHAGSRLSGLAIGRWNEEAWEFEVVTEWCQTWEDLEEEARQAVKSFRGVASPRERRASNV